ncbi:hypothetical protein Taro_015409 [Colocasia esculenta]|uniref:Uncharacterized protein n=1 Tax=Colocasia esculenta TaxID=4460 RepID=A0A843UHN5_COLES|nr:hypothetical protein [Colocasia esculenta]
MEVVVPVMAADFIFDSSSTTPYVSAPSSPRPLGEWPSSPHYYTSAPTSPTRAAAIFREFSAAMSGGLASPRASSHRSSVIPFEWEDAPGAPKSPPHSGEEADDAEGDGDEVDDFAFEFSGQLEMGCSSPLTADELFEEGMIRPLKPPPRLQYVPPEAGAARENGSSPSPRSPRTPKSPKSPRSRLFFRRREKDEEFDPFAKAIEKTTRGRERANPPGQSTGLARRAARSLSPLRGVFDFGHKSSANQPGASTAADGSSTPASASGSAGTAAAARWIKGGSKKWRLRDLLLFRSASEGRATGSGARDPLRKYTVLSPSWTAMLSRKGSAASISSAASVSGGEDTKNASFRSTDSGSVGGSSRRGSAVGSAHGRHYAAASRAAAEEMRRRTMLPYRQQGLFGCLNFNPAINGLARGFSSFSRSGA